MKQRDLYPINEARERLGGMSRNLIYKMMDEGRLATVLVRGRRFIPAAAIAQFIANNTTTTSPTELAARSATPTKRNPNLSASPFAVLACIQVTAEYDNEIEVVLDVISAAAVRIEVTVPPSDEEGDEESDEEGDEE